MYVRVCVFVCECEHVRAYSYMEMMNTMPWLITVHDVINLLLKYFKINLLMRVTKVRFFIDSIYRH